MEVRVKVQCGTEALHKRDRSAVGVADSETAGHAALTGKYLANKDSEDVGEKIRIFGEAKADAFGKGEQMAF